MSIEGKWLGRSGTGQTGSEGSFIVITRFTSADRRIEEEEVGRSTGDHQVAEKHS